MASDAQAGMNLPIVYADDAILVLDKPAGLLTVPGRGEDKQDCLSARVQAVFPEARIVHRLDMATSGLVIMARSAEVQRTLGDAFAARQVHKRYEAVVDGTLGPPVSDWGVIDLPIILDWPNRPLSIVDPVNGKPSTTRWQVIADPSSPAKALPIPQPSTRLALEPVTGRSHQLRVHLLALGHPILGDRLYASAEIAERTPRLMLHACHLSLAHPVTGDSVCFSSPVPF